MMVALQKGGCHNINFVTPTHVIAPILQALPIAVEKGLRVPLVYNCGGYERVSALKLLEGIVDIYMPDFKFWEREAARQFCGAPDYPFRAREALREMHRQVGELVCDSKGIPGGFGSRAKSGPHTTRRLQQAPGIGIAYSTADRQVCERD
ncbi:MAG: hypothetical protein ACP5SH_10740 [Syntrophobacteraceae bacterium]